MASSKQKCYVDGSAALKDGIDKDWMYIWPYW